MMVSPRQAFVRWYDQLIAADPGLDRLRFAGRATLTVGATLGLEIAFAHVVGRSFFSFLIGVVVSMISSLAVSDPGLRQQRVTSALLGVPAMMSVALATLLSFSPYLAQGFFLAVMFGAVYIRRFGPRWFAFGMVSFICYFFAMFLRANLSQLPWMCAAIVVGSAVSYVFRFWILPDPSRPSARFILPAVRARLRLLLSALRAGVKEPQRQDRHAMRLREQAVYLSDILLLDVEEEGRESWEDAFFTIEIAAEGIAALGRDLVSVADRRALAHDIEAVRSELRRRSPRPSDTLSWRTDPETGLGKVLRRLLDAVACAGTSTRPEEPVREDEYQDDRTAEDKQEGLRPTTRHAIQVVVAGVMAIAGGEALSDKRWYWAAITAFIVFTGTDSRGQVFVKGWQRVAGTFLGVGAGILIATGLHGNQVGSFALIFTSIFMGFYFLPVSYGLMIFWITILIALLYGLLGFFSVQLLELRFEETAIGAAAGILVAVLVLPTRTRSLARQQSQAFLRTLVAVIGDSTQPPGKPGSEPAILRRVRELDRNFQTLRQATRPLTMTAPGMSTTRVSQHWIRVIHGLRHQAHLLARQAAMDWREPADVSEDSRHLAETVRARIDRVAKAIANRSIDSHALRQAQDAPHGWSAPSETTAASAAGRCLQRIDWITTILAEDIGVEQEAGNND